MTESQILLAKDSVLPYTQGRHWRQVACSNKNLRNLLINYRPVQSPNAHCHFSTQNTLRQALNLGCSHCWTRHANTHTPVPAMLPDQSWTQIRLILFHITNHPHSGSQLDVNSYSLHNTPLSLLIMLKTLNEELVFEDLKAYYAEKCMLKTLN